MYENFHENVFERLFGGKGYDWPFLFFFFNFEEALTSFHFRNFDQLSKFAFFVDDFTENVLNVTQSRAQCGMNTSPIGTCLLHAII